MVRIGITALAAAGALALTGAPAAAQAISAADPDGVATLLSSQGFKADLTENENTDPMLFSETGGTPFVIFFFDCTKHRQCRTLQFYAGFRQSSVSFERINAWNAKSRFGRAYIDDAGDPRMEMDVTTEPGGIAPALFRENLNTWTRLVAEFKEHIGF